jgi:hypothetical protein
VKVSVSLDNETSALLAAYQRDCNAKLSHIFQRALRAYLEAQGYEYIPATVRKHAQS